MNDVWTDNFSWDYGRFSPKNIIVPSDDRLRYDEEKKLKERGEEVEEEEDIYDEIYSPEINYDDHFMNLHMETDASQPKVRCTGCSKDFTLIFKSLECFLGHPVYKV